MQARQARRPGRGRQAAAERWHGLFFLAIAAVVTAMALGLALVAGAACDTANPAGPLLPTIPAVDPSTPTPEPTKQTTTPLPPGASNTNTPAAPTETATATVATTPVATSATSSATAPPTRTPDNANVLACGDPLAPLNKKNRLAENCAPGDLVELDAAQGTQYLRAGAAAAFAELVAAAEKDGFSLVAVSAYRSYSSQIAAYQSNVSQFGQEYADRVSAKPGHSEHQLGTTVDVSSASAGYGLESFTGTPEAKWLADNAHRFGFVISYPAGKEGITGYAYEPWHIRWVGTGVAGAVKSSGTTLHQYLGGG
ncbi:MAG: D-alanyl-D-alanine carboxypeptidase family protein [Dehalococcoidia bacterium]